MKAREIPANKKAPAIAAFNVAAFFCDLGFSAGLSFIYLSADYAD